MHALSVMADAAGPMFRSHVESILNLALKLLFNTPPYQEELHRSIGRLLSALITVVGPELQGNGYCLVNLVWKHFLWTYIGSL